MGHHKILIWSGSDDLEEAVTAANDFVGKVGDDNNWFTALFAVNAQDETWWTTEEPVAKSDPPMTFEGLLDTARPLFLRDLAGDLVVPTPAEAPSAETGWPTLRSFVLDAVAGRVDELRKPESSPSHYRLRCLVDTLIQLDRAAFYPFADETNSFLGILYGHLRAFALDAYEDHEWHGERRGSLVVVDVHT